VKRRLQVGCLVLSFLACAPARPPQPSAPLALSFYANVDLRKDDAVAALAPIWRRAAAAGYTQVMLADVHFARPEAFDAHFLANIAAVKSLARETGLEVVPGVFQVGRSNVMLGSDPNLAEGVPVRDALFEVRDGAAHLIPDPPVTLRDGPDTVDPEVRVEDGVAVIRNSPGRARFRFHVRVAPFRCYHVSVRLRSRAFRGEPLITAVGNRQVLDYLRPFEMAPNQDWTTVDVVFNSLEHRELDLWMGLWSRSRGELAWKDWTLEEVGLLNVLRRPGAPCTVTGYLEGRDYEPIRDAALEAARSSGNYTEWHTPPVVRTHLPDGTRLRISWYHPAFFYGGKTTCCPADSGTFALLEAEAKRMRAAWGAAGYLLMQNEIRCMNQDPSCAAAGSDAGAVLAVHMRRCLAMLGGARGYVWSDMFDPAHNAHAGYFLDRGSLRGSWEGLGKDAVIVNWNAEHPRPSLQFFSARGHRQIIAGYYDGDVRAIVKRLAAARGVPGVVGVMYATWQGRYDDLEKFAVAVRSAWPE
jgi:hypothetical protein